jgi:hypothetical protein
LDFRTDRIWENRGLSVAHLQATIPCERRQNGSFFEKHIAEETPK